MLIRSFLFAFLFSVSVYAQIWDSKPLNYRLKRFYKGQFVSQVDQKPRDFIVLLPVNYSPEKEVELIYFLSGGTGYAEGMPDQLEYSGFRLDTDFFRNKLWVSLGMDNHAMWSNNVKEKSSDIFLEFIAYFESQVKHTGPRNLVGHSLGGSGSMHMAFDYPQYFQRIASVSPPILMWNVYEATEEKVAAYIREHAPTVPVEYFTYVVNEMKKDFGSAEAYMAYDFYTRIQIKELPKCFSIFMGGQDPMGFAYLAKEFLKFAESKGQSINYVEDPQRQHELGAAVTEVGEYFSRCEI